MRSAGRICGVAGLLIASRLNSAQPALGQGYELDAIAAVVIGGTSLSGGRGTVLGTLIGALIISVLANGLRILSVRPGVADGGDRLDHHPGRLCRHPAAPHTLGAGDRAPRTSRGANDQEGGNAPTRRQLNPGRTYNAQQTYSARRHQRRRTADRRRRCFGQDDSTSP